MLSHGCARGCQPVLGVPAVALVAPEGLCHQQRSSQALGIPWDQGRAPMSLQGEAQGWLSEQRSSGEEEEEEEGSVRKAPEEQSAALPYLEPRAWC